jgi:hypothetical protein
MDLLRRLLRKSVLVLPLAVGGCLWVSNLMSNGGGPAFPHAKHGEEAGLECANCHRDALTGDMAGMPSQKQCQLCHKELDADKPEERRSSAFFADGVLKGKRVTAITADVKFSHKVHAGDQQLDCSRCHGDVATSTAVGPEVRVTMKKCTECHAGAPGKAGGWANECDVCHKEIRADQKPPSHATDWTREHGRVVRREGGAEPANCNVCHTKSACQTCHQTEEPADHTNYWRQRGHGVAVAIDRDRCATCHKSDSCDRCHSDTSPISHTAGWGGPQDRHCLTCHFPLGRNDGCATCHHGTPSHLLATPMPPNHTPGMNCRQCHGLTAPLPHVDKGDSCTACHK